MECLKTRKMMKNYLEDSLEEDLFLQTRDHLLGCSGCQDYFGSFSCLRTDLKKHGVSEHFVDIEDLVEKQFSSRLSDMRFLLMRFRRIVVQGLAVFLVGLIFYHMGSEWYRGGFWGQPQRLPIENRLDPPKVRPPEVAMLERTMRLLERSATRLRPGVSSGSTAPALIMPVLQWRPIHMDLVFPSEEQSAGEILKKLETLGTRLPGHESFWIFQVKLGQLDEFLNQIEPYRVDPPQKINMGALSRSDPEGLIFISLSLRDRDRFGMHLHVKFHLDNAYQIRSDLKSRFMMVQDSEDFWVFEIACQDVESFLKVIRELPGARVEWSSPLPVCEPNTRIWISLAAR